MLATRLASTLVLLVLTLAPRWTSDDDMRGRDDGLWSELRPWLAALHSWEPEVEHVAAFLTPGRTGLRPGEAWQLSRLVVAESRRASVPPELVLAVIRVESSGRPTVVSHKGAVGLMQLLPPTAEAEARRLGLPWSGPESLHDPYLNVRVGIHYLARLIERFDDVETALAAYNAGPTRIARRLRSSRALPEGYARRVLETVVEPTRV